MEWKPMYVVSLLGPEGGDLASQKLSFSLGKEELRPHFFTASFDGELVYADISKPEVQNPLQQTGTMCPFPTSIVSSRILTIAVCRKLACVLERWDAAWCDKAHFVAQLLKSVGRLFV